MLAVASLAFGSGGLGRAGFCGGSVAFARGRGGRGVQGRGVGFDLGETVGDGFGGDVCVEDRKLAILELKQMPMGSLDGG